jgi:hypothetical protein
MTARLALATATILLASLAWFAHGEIDAPTALTEEDVVRLFVQGMPADELVRKIETSPGSYDLSDEMVEELKIAGIPEKVLNAMIRRQAEMHAVVDTAEPQTRPGRPRLIVRLNPDWKATDDKPLPKLLALDAVDPDLAQRLGLRSSDQPITDLGIALFCRTADHVPDHWRSKTPLGRDFGNSARHRMLVFLSGADSTPASKLRNTMSKMFMAPGMRDSIADLNVLSLEIPERLAIEIDPGVAHDLTLGIVLNIGGRNYLTLTDTRDSVLVGNASDTTISAELRGSSKNPLSARVKFLDETAAN